MKYSTATEISDDKLKSIDLLLKVKQSNPTIDSKHVIKMIEEILYPSNSTWIEKPGTKVKPDDLNVNFDNGNSKDDFSQNYELIGKVKEAGQHTGSRSMKFLNNPWKVVIGRYARCPVCQKVSIEGMKMDRNAASDRTYLRHTYTHFDGSAHSTGLANVDGQFEYEQLVKMKKEGKLKA